MTTRCAIYTRKSTEEGLKQDFNTLDAQRESGEAYVASQKTQGWTVLPDRYDDGGYSGGNVERPAFRQLMQDIEAGKIDCVVVYKIDRLSRSLADFARIMDVFDKHGVTLVSVTQHFNTTSSMGRLTLNILLSFAQFEREIISERTRDKIGAMRRRGKHWGGHPILGYDVVREASGSRLVINPQEAEQVRTMFDLYMEHRAMMPVVEELARRGWRSKVWATKAGEQRGGGVLDKPALWRLLTNPVYIGMVRYQGETYEGEQDAIIDEENWKRVQATLTSNGRSGGHDPSTIRRDDMLLRGLLVCRGCGKTMQTTYTKKRTKTAGTKRYRYYVCSKVTKSGRGACDCPRLPAEQIEQFVVQEIHAVARDVDLRRGVLEQAQAHIAADRSPDKLKLNRAAVDAALADFDMLWQTYSPQEQYRLVQLLIERVEFDYANQKLAITFCPAGIATLGQQDEPEEIAA